MSYCAREAQLCKRAQGYRGNDRCDEHIHDKPARLRQYKQNTETPNKMADWLQPARLRQYTQNTEQQTKWLTGCNLRNKVMHTEYWNNKQND